MLLLCHADYVKEGEAKGVAVDGHHYIVVMRDATLHVYINSCPHLGIPLEWQPNQFLDEDGELLRCSTHGALFVIETGHCIAGPCAGAYLTRVATLIKDNQLWLTNP